MKLFSERYGYTKPSDVIIREKITPEIQNAICSCYDKLKNRLFLAYIIHSGFISGYQNRYGDNLKPPTNVYHRMTA